MPTYNPEEMAFLQSALAALQKANSFPFGQHVRVTGAWHQGCNLWVTSRKPRLFTKHRYHQLRSDERQTGGLFQWGPVWRNEADLAIAGDRPMSSFLRDIALNNPATQKLGRRWGLWVTNGDPGQHLNLMYEGLPGAVTCIYDYLGPNKVFEYKAAHPEVPIIVRIMHHQNWMQDPAQSAKDMAELVVSKWPDMKVLDPYVYFANELNLGYESGQPDIPALDTEAFYLKCGTWITDIAQRIKDAIPEMKLVCPPFAYGHHEDGEPDDSGSPKIGWAGYDYLASTIRIYFDNTICFHGYWGDGRGRIADRLYNPELSSWHAFRWQRVLKLFETRYNIKAKVIIDEASSFNVKHPEFFNDVEYYTKECLSDRRVLAVTYFLWYDAWDSAGNSKNDWVRNISNLSQFIARLKVLPDVAIAIPPPESEPEPTPEPIPEPPHEPEPEIPTLHVDYKGGDICLIQGDIGEPGVKIIYRFWGNYAEVMSGHKPELGEGGFQFNAYAGEHKLEINGIEYSITAKEGLNIVSSLDSEPEEQMYQLTSSALTEDEADEIIEYLRAGGYAGKFTQSKM